VSMTCAEAEELVPWVANGTVPAAQRAAVHGHVAGCDACRRDLAQALALQRRLRATVEQMSEADADAGRRLAASLIPVPARRKPDAVTLTTSALRALGAPTALTRPLDLLQRLANWRPSADLIAPFVPTGAQATSVP
jgi:anti-sigma factor RsiW